MILLLFTSCSQEVTVKSEDPSAEEVMDGFLGALAKKDIETTLEFLTISGQRNYERFVRSGAWFNVYEHLESKNPRMTLGGDSVREYGLTQIINGERWGLSITLLKENGLWKVDSI